MDYRFQSRYPKTVTPRLAKAGGTGSGGFPELTPADGTRRAELPSSHDACVEHGIQVVACAAAINFLRQPDMGSVCSPTERQRMDAELREACWNADLSSSSKIVLLGVVWHSDDTDHSFPPPVSEMADLCGVSTRTVQNALRSLRDSGVIVAIDCSGGRGNTASYKIDRDRLVELARADEPKHDPRMAISANLRIQVYAKTIGTCWYCTGTMTLDHGLPNSFTIDHAIPVSRGGGNDLNNLVPACRRCNAEKRTMTADEFLAKRGAV